MLLKNLLQDFKYRLVGASLDYEIKCISTDAKTKQKNCLYILLKPKLDINELPSSDAVVIVQSPPEEKIKLPYVICPDIRAAMAYVYSRFYEIDYKRLSFIGITGTNGKSSTLTILSEILKADGHKVGCIKTGEMNINGRVITSESYSMTTPDPHMLYKGIKDMESEGCDTIVMEVSSHSLALSKVAPIFFDYAVFTGLSPEHLDFHVDMEEYFETKKLLFQRARCAIINVDDEYGKRLFSELDIKKMSFAVMNDADAYIDEYEYYGLSGASFKFKLLNRHINIRLQLPGCYNVYNAISAITVASDMEISPYVIRDSVRNIKVIEGRFQILSSSPAIIVDYAHTAHAFESFLNELKRLKGEKRLTVIFGCGGDRDKGKRVKMGELSELYADRIILTSDNSRTEEPMDIIRDILAGVKSKPVYIDTERPRIVENTILSATDNDIIAVIGKGTEKYFVDKNGYHKYDEIELIRSVIQKREKENAHKT